jgi:hypothetical protein
MAVEVIGFRCVQQHGEVNAIVLEHPVLGGAVTRFAELGRPGACALAKLLRERRQRFGGFSERLEAERGQPHVEPVAGGGAIVVGTAPGIW